MYDCPVRVAVTFPDRTRCCKPRNASKIREESIVSRSREKSNADRDNVPLR
jgi:hypothetical protein